jgi:ribosomal protein S18 acetylase RimI-like enzyme
MPILDAPGTPSRPVMTDPLLDNIIWHSLAGRQRSLAIGTGEARRYAPGYSPILAFADPGRADLSALNPYCDVGEPIYCADWSGPVPPEWTLEREATMLRMVWDGPPAVDDPAADATALGPEHAAEALDLATLTRPGPFAIRTIEMGDYFGYFEQGRLIAMAGERMWAGPYREISGVCTHPDYQGRGLARRLTLKLVHRELLRGETPFLHVVSGNTGAIGLYRKMGFRTYCETPVRVVTRG